MDGQREVVTSTDGTPIGLLTAGTGPPLLLVHGGLLGRDRFAPLWERLTGSFQVTAIDRRGRGSSGDGVTYDITREYSDVAAVAAHLAQAFGGPVDGFGHSIGGVILLGAAGVGAAEDRAILRRLAVYEPPGPPTVTVDWLSQLRELIAAERHGPAVAAFLTDVVGLTSEQVLALRDAPRGPHDVLAIAARTLVREAQALADLDLAALAGPVRQPVLLMRGTASPPWAAQVVHALVDGLSRAEVVELEGAGHEGVDTSAAEVANHLLRFLRTAVRRASE